MNMQQLKSALKIAKVRLEEAGWRFTHSVMHDGGATGEYGSSYVKDGRQFYLNKDTVNNLPA